MKKLAVAMVAGLASQSLFADFSVSSTAFENEKFLPSQFAYCKSAPNGEAEMSQDISPPLSWSGAPKGTQSFAVITRDPDAVNAPFFNLPGKTIPENFQRVTVYHWVLVNIPATITSLPEKVGSAGFVIGGKPVGKTPYGLTGENVYSGFLSSPLAERAKFGANANKDLSGTYGNYDGPCPPWNDLRVHGYEYTVYALDVEKLNLPEDGHFTGEQAIAAMQNHILAQATLVGKYTTNKAF